MKKLIALAVLSVAGLGLSVGQASAWWCCHKQPCNKCSTVICLTPYNAFTPVCCGNLACNGCCPMQFAPGCQSVCGSNCGWGGACAAPSYGACGPTCGDTTAYGLGQLPILDATVQKSPATTVAPSAPPATVAPAQSFQAPAPTPGPASFVPGLQSSQLPLPAGLQTVGYQQPSATTLGAVPNAFSGQK